MITVLSAGTGTPKFLIGLRKVVPDEEITVVVNTADDFVWNGLYVSPDLDTVTYLFADMLDTSRFWGVRGDTFNFLEQCKALGMRRLWFKIGDRDLATHVLRTYLMRRGFRLHEVTKYICSKLNVRANVMPMTNDRVRTYVLTDRGPLHIQEFVVKHRMRLEVYGITFKNLGKARPVPGIEVVRRSKAVIIGPSNPVNGIGPILGVRGIREMIRELKVPKVLISPLVEDRPVSGVADKFMRILGYEPSILGLYEMFKDLITHIVIDVRDRKYVEVLRERNVEVIVTNIVMRSEDDSQRLAEDVLREVGLL